MLPEEKKTILIIDDDLTIRKLIGYHLKDNGYGVLEAEGAEEGFKFLFGEKVDLVLCDITMQDMDGYTFCKKVRENDRYRVLPFVFVTAKSSIEDKSKALEVGGDDIITKPFEAKELILKIKALLKRADIYKLYGEKKSVEESFTEEKSKILLVDDDLALAKLFQYNFTKAGFECIAAYSAADALKIAKDSAPDIIVSDIMMPQMDGFAFRRKLLEDPQLKQIPFVFLTSKSSEDDILNGYDLGIADYVVKTAGPRVVVAKVSAIIKSLGKERQKAVSELHRAADSIHVAMVPDNFPVFAGFEIKHWHQTYKGIPGGDFLDYFNLDEDNIAVILGDVMGKKWKAWYFAFAYAGYVRSAIRVVLQSAKEFSPKDILTQVNSSIYQDAKISEVFTILSVLVINKKEQTAKYSGAGDLPIILRRGLTGEAVQIKSNGLLLGFMPEGNYDDTVVKLNQNDCLFMYTDGLADSRNASGEEYGRYLLDTIQSFNLQNDPLDELKNSFTEFTSGKFEDDVSLISVKVL
jgi:Response regulator containing a CheY-like receiver domain and a GGDEF domain